MHSTCVRSQCVDEKNLSKHNFVDKKTSQGTLKFQLGPPTVSLCALLIRAVIRDTAKRELYLSNRQ